jgi:hypothetical protein
MWLYAYEAVTQAFLPGVNDGFIAQDPYFTLLLAKRVQFLDVMRGYASIATTLRSLREENERSRRMRQAIQDEHFDELDGLNEDEDDEDVFEMSDIY